MADIILSKASQLWKKIAKGGTPSEVTKLTYELELHKKMFTLFQVGDYYYYVFNCSISEFEFVHENLRTLLGYDPDTHSIHSMLSYIHPDDQIWFLNFENTVTDFFTNLPPEKVLKYKVQYDYRIRHTNGHYIRILQQVVTLERDEQGGVLRTLGVHTDISRLKPEGKPILSFIGLEGEPSFLNVDPKTLFTPSKDILSKREKEILTLMIQGMNSRQMAAYLGLSEHTIKNHRKKMLCKTQTKSTSNMIAKVVSEGWLPHALSPDKASSFIKR
jgi:DNA-binding CsgD family transcriptional regulator